MTLNLVVVTFNWTCFVKLRTIHHLFDSEFRCMLGTFPSITLVLPTLIRSKETIGMSSETSLISLKPS